MSELGVVVYRGPSLLTGDPIVGIVTGLEGGSHNPKTGPMAQAYILRPDLAPMDAKRRNLDDAICGDCTLRGRDGKDSGCYVTPWQGPHQVWKMFSAGGYPDASWPDLHALLEQRHVRLGAYGDPAAIPFEVWRQLLTTVAGHVGYTHQWTRCDQRFKAMLMASVDSERELFEAWAHGWRTFRVRLQPDPLVQPGRRTHIGSPRALSGEFVCPASDEAGMRTTCQRCQLCRGTSSPARSVAIVAHGKPSNLKAFGIDVRGLFPGRPRKVVEERV